MSASGEAIGGESMERLAALPIDVTAPAPIAVSRLGAPLLLARDANTFAARLRGLHGMLPLGPTDALVIRPCNAVQTYRMPCAIDVAFLDRHGKVLRVEHLTPGRACLCIGARVVIEMAAGTASRLSLVPGHVLSSSTGSWT